MLYLQFKPIIKNPNCSLFYRADQTIARSSTPNTLSVQIPCASNGSSKTTVNASHSMPNVSDGQVNGSSRICEKPHESKYGIDVSIEDVSESKSEKEQSRRAPSFKSPSKGDQNMLN